MENKITRWLRDFETAVNTRNFGSGLDLYSQKSTMFGTRVVHSEDLNEYLVFQWKKIWESSKNFKFIEVLDSRLFLDGSGFCATLWENFTKIDGRENLRQGRATFVYTTVEEKLLAVHSHFSESPTV